MDLIIKETIFANYIFSTELSYDEGDISNL